MAYENLKNTINENKITTATIKADEWNGLFNILAEQANYLDEKLSEAFLRLSESNVIVSETAPENPKQNDIWFEI